MCGNTRQPRYRPRPFRVVESDCRCSCRHFNSGECIICILAVRPLRAGTMSPGIKWAPARFPTVRQMRTACPLSCPFFPPFSRVVARDIRIKGERISVRRFRKRTVKDQNPMFPLLTKRFRRMG